MEAPPPWDPVSNWPYYADDTLQPEDLPNGQLADQYSTISNSVGTSASPHSNTSPNAMQSTSNLSPMTSGRASMSGYSKDPSYFESNMSSNSPNVNQNQYTALGTSNEGLWAHSSLLGNMQHNPGQDDYPQTQGLSSEHTMNLDGVGEPDYRTWQANTVEDGLDSCDPTSYGSILEELNQMDASMFADGNYSLDQPQYADMYPSQDTIGPKAESIDAVSLMSTTADSSEEALLPISPISNDDTGKAASKATKHPAAKTKPLPKKSAGRPKIPHSAVEKRYRSNLNTKLLDLQQCVPALHVDTDEDDELESPGSQKKAVKLQKGLILSGAADYIRTLSVRTSELESHNELLERRLAVLQRIALKKTNQEDTSLKTADRKSQRLTAAPKPISPMSPADPIPQPGSRLRRTKNKNIDEAGLSKNFKRALNEYGREAPNDLITTQEPSSKKRQKLSRGALAKVAVSSLIGLALWDGYSDSESTAGVPNGRGLFALPMGLVRSSIRQLWSAASPYLQFYTSLNVWALVEVFLILGLVVYVLEPIVLAALSWTGKNKHSTGVAASSISPLPVTVEFCRKAWSTAAQSLWIPEHGVMLEALALAIKTCKLVLRRICGWEIYSYITGATFESEIARIKAWDIALDAQLAGGDPNAEFRRLLLTFLASMTIEDTPLRLLRKSLHVRLIFWNISNTLVGHRLGVGSMAKSISDHFWTRAIAMHEKAQESRSDPNGGMELLEVPSHILELLRQGSAAVLVDAIVIRTSRVARNESWNGTDTTADEGMDAVFDDISIRSPLDALSALYSSVTLRNALLATLQNGGQNERQKSVDVALHLALITAPPGSRAEMRARAAQAVFIETGRMASITAALKEMPKQRETDDGYFHFVEPPIASICTTNVRIALRAAALIAGTKGSNATRYPLRPSTRLSMIRIIEKMLQSTDVTILGFATAYRCARVCYADSELEKEAGPELISLINKLRSIAASQWSSKFGVDQKSIRFDSGFARRQQVL